MERIFTRMIGNRLLEQSRLSGASLLTLMMMLVLLLGFGSLRTSAESVGEVGEFLTQSLDAQLFACPFEPTLRNEQLLKLPAATAATQTTALYLLLLPNGSGVNDTRTLFLSYLSSPAFLPRPPPCS
jgi:hypothetical protein